MNEERCKRLESRQRATDERVTALVEALHAYHKPDASLNNFRELVDHLAALRAPGEGAHPRNEGPGGCVPWEEAEKMRASLATARRERDAYRKAKEENDERFMTERDDARRERDEAVAIVRDWLVWRSVHHVSDVHFPDLASVLSRARALVAGQATPDARDAEIAGWREASKAMTGEIADLRAYLGGE